MTTGLSLTCDQLDLAAYVDGELEEARAAAVDSHVASCSDCRDELNFQKQMLSMLDGGLKREAEIELPPDFAKKVVRSAENNVAGLRPASERFNAIFIVAALSLFALFAIGTESSFFSGVRLFLEQAYAVASIVGQTAYGFLVGIFVVVRTVASVASDSRSPAMGLLLTVVLLLFSISYIRFRRA